MRFFEKDTLLRRLGILLLVLALTLTCACSAEPVQDEITASTTEAPSLTTEAPQTQPPVQPEQTDPTEPVTTETADNVATEPSTEPSTEPATQAPTQTDPPVPEVQVVTPPDHHVPPQATTNPGRPNVPIATEPAPTAPTVTEPDTQPPTEPVTTPPATEAPTEPSTAPIKPVPEERPQPQQPQTGSFKIHFIDVGQADAALVQCDGMNMLIDGGNAEDSNVMYTYLKKQGVTRLDYVIGTHAHEDHIGGIAGALNYATVAKAFCPVTSYDSRAFSNFVKGVNKHGCGITVPSVGDRFSLGSASCQVLGVNSTDDTNNTSIVLRIVYGSTSFLFTGDAEQEAESIIMGRGYDLQSTVLKVGHHGSDTSTSYRWLREVAPEYAVISVGKGNTYGHPTQTVLSRLRDAEVTTFRTDLQGDIICTSDGRTVQFTTNRNTDIDVFPEIEGGSQSGSSSSPDADYVLNTNSMKFHDPGCRAAKSISPKNRKDFHGSRQELLNSGYDPCGICDP